MNAKDEQISWLQNILSCLALIGLILLYLFLKREKLAEQFHIWELVTQVIPDLIAALMTVIVLYWVFIRKGISDQHRIVEQIKHIVNDKNEAPSFLPQPEADQEFNLKSRLRRSKEVMISGYSCKYVVDGLRNELIQAIRQGTNIKVMVIAPNSESAILLADNQVFKEIDIDLIDFNRKIAVIQEKISHFKGKKIGQLEVCYIDWIPSCSMIFAIPKNGDAGTLKLKVYAPSGNTPLTKIKTHMLIEEAKEKELFEYFKDEYQKMWVKGK